MSYFNAPSKGMGNGKIPVTPNGINETGEPRESTLQVQSGSAIRSVRLKQLCKPYFGFEDEAYFQFDWDDVPQTIEINTGDYEWYVSTNQDWIHVMDEMQEEDYTNKDWQPASQEGGLPLTIVCDSNEDYDTRFGSIVFRYRRLDGSDSYGASAEIEQAPNPF